MDETGVTLLHGDARTVLKSLPAESVQMIVTSPPYWSLRSYIEDGHADKAREIGLEAGVDEHLTTLVELFREARRCLRRDGVMALNYGDCFATSPAGNTPVNGRIKAGADGGSFRANRPVSSVGQLPAKNLLMLPARLAIALQADGWILRSMMPWVKRSAMPESATDRPSNAVEYVFVFSKSQRYFWDADAVRRGNGKEASWEQYERRKSKGSWESGGVSRFAHANKHDAATHPNGRNLRNSDFYFDSLDLLIEATRAELAHLLHVREKGGLLMSGEEPLALDVNPQALADAHFASFPEKLVAPLIQAGSSEYGVCGTCGAPWARVTEKSGEYQAHWAPGKQHKQAALDKGRVSSGGVMETGMVKTYRTTGWQASCKCDGPVVPATVLDPFAGSGTVMKVATKLGRRSIGIDLNEQYLDIARKRNAQLGLMI